MKERKTPERKVAEVVEIEEVEKMEEVMPVGDSKVRTAPEVFFFFSLLQLAPAQVKQQGKVRSTATWS